MVSKTGNYQKISTPNIREKVYSRKTPPFIADSSDGDADGNNSCNNARLTTEILLSRHATNSKIVLTDENRSNKDLDCHQYDMVGYL